MNKYIPVTIVLFIIFMMTGCQCVTSGSIASQKLEPPKFPFPQDIMEKHLEMEKWYLANWGLTSTHEGNKPFVALSLSYLALIHEQQKKILANQEEIFALLKKTQGGK